MNLRDKSFIFLGDSITEGACASAPQNAFHQIIKKECGLKEAFNAGIGGTRIAKQTVPSENLNYDLYFACRVDILPERADAVVVFGGTNDYGHGDAKIGNIEDDDVYTFFGGLNTLYKRLTEKYPNSKLIFITPLKRTNETVPNPTENKVLSDYVECIKDFCVNKNIAVIDLYNSNILDPYNADLVPDGLHPNDAGHKIIAEYIAKKLTEI